MSHFYPLLCVATSLVGDVNVDAYGDPLPTGAMARLGTVRLRHGSIVNAIVFSPDGKLLFSGGGDSTIRIWQRDTGKELAHLKGHTGPVQSLQLSTDGNTLISHGSDNTVRFWDVTTRQEVRRLPRSKDIVTSVVLSRDGRTLFTGGNTGIIRQWLAPTGLELRQFTTQPGGIKALAVSPDGRQLISAGMDGSVRLWDVGQGTQLRLLDQGGAIGGLGFSMGLALSPDGNLLATGATARAVGLRDMTTFKDVGRWPGGPPRGGLLAFSPNSKVLAVGDRNPSASIRLFGVATGTELRQLDVQNAQLNTITFSPDGKFLAAGSSDYSIRVWDVATSRELHPPRGHSGFIQSVQFSRDGSKVLSTSTDRTARVWDTATGKELGRFEGHRVSVVGGGMLHDGKTFITGSYDSIVQWQLQDGVAQEIRHYDIPRTGFSMTSLVVSPDGKWMAGVAGQAIRVWNLTAQDDSHAWNAAASVQSLLFSPDSKLLISYGSFGPMQIWDVASGRMTRQLGPPRSNSVVAFSVDGTTLASYENGVRLWEVASGQERAQISFLGFPSALAFSPDGFLLAIGSPTGSIRLWNMHTGTEMGELQGQQGNVKLAFSPDGTKLLSGGTDTTMLIWDMTAWTKKRQRQRVQLQPDEIELSWQLLAGGDAAKAYQAIGSLVAAPEQAVTMLKGRLRPMPAVKPGQIEQWIADLDNNVFARRQKALTELEKLEELAEAALHKAAKSPSRTLESRRAIEQLLAKLKTPNPEVLRPLRAVEALEQIDTPEARQVLAVLAEGGTGLRLTEAARGALERHAKRSR